MNITNFGLKKISHTCSELDKLDLVYSKIIMNGPIVSVWREVYRAIGLDD